MTTKDLFALARVGALVSWVDPRTGTIKRGRVMVRNDKIRTLMVNLDVSTGTGHAVIAEGAILSVVGGGETPPEDNQATPEEIARAREEYALGSDDDIEVDDNAKASRGEGGVWVSAWVWLGDKA